MIALCMRKSSETLVLCEKMRTMSKRANKLLAFDFSSIERVLIRKSHGNKQQAFFSLSTKSKSPLHKYRCQRRTRPTIHPRTMNAYGGTIQT